MSSILRALKKLETEPGHTGEKQPLDTKFAPLSDVSRQKSTVPLLKAAIAGGIVCGLIVLAGWQLFSGRKEAVPVAVPPAAEQQARQAEIKSPAPATAEPAAASPVAVEAERAEEAAEPVLEAKPAVAARKTTEVEVVPEPLPAAEPEISGVVNKQAQETSGQSQDILQPADARVIPAEKTAPPEPAPPQVSFKAKEPEIPVLNDPDMKLQAITWSKDPQKRIAVINNRILRQGDAVSGYRIATINQDDIILNDGGEKWKLLFRIR